LGIYSKEEKGRNTSKKFGLHFCCCYLKIKSGFSVSKKNLQKKFLMLSNFSTIKHISCFHKNIAKLSFIEYDLKESLIRDSNSFDFDS